MQDTSSWQHGYPRDARGPSPTPLETSSVTSASNLASATVETMVSSISSKGHARAIAITVGSAVGVLSMGIIVFASLKWWKDRRRARARAREPEIWRDRNTETLDGIGSASNGRIFLPVSPNLDHVSSSSIHISPGPPTIILSPGWPRRNLARDEDEKRRRYGFTRNSRLLADTPYEDIIDDDLGKAVSCEINEERRRSVSTTEAIAGSAGPSVAPSRTTSQSQRRARRTSKLAGNAPPLPPPTLGHRPLPNIPPSRDILADRYRRASSRWSWSHRATYHEDEPGVRDTEPLPAYSERRRRSRSMSTTRSRSRRSSMHDLGEGSLRASNALLNLPEYPLELARKVAQAYPREPRTPPPPGYSS